MRYSKAPELWRACRFIQIQNNNVSRFGESSYDASYRRLLLRKSSVLSVSVSVALLRELPGLNDRTL